MILLDLFLATALPYFLFSVIPILTRGSALSFPPVPRPARSLPVFHRRTIILKSVPENRFPLLKTS